MSNMFIDDTVKRYPVLREVSPKLEASLQALIHCFQSGSKLLVCGNGGSASDSDHIVGELLKGFISKRTLRDSDVEKIENCFPGEGVAIANNLQYGLPAISLTCNGAINSAIANDTNPEYIFAQQVFALGKKGDVFLGISTSGNSKNIVHAIKVAKSLGMTTISLTGEGGGALKSLSDININVGANKVHEVQELHLPVYHALCAAVEHHFFEQESPEMVEAPSATEKNQKKSYDNIELIVFDFDGVFTNNKVLVNENGTESVICDRSDGLLIKDLKQLGIPIFILSTEANKVVQARANKLKLDCEQNCSNKRKHLEEHCKKHNINPNNVIFIGNDTNDLEVMNFVGHTLAPSDAHPKILRTANHILKSPGGHGAVREFCEIMLKQ